MKKLDKLQISPDRRMKDDELVKLKGGVSACYCSPFGFILGEESCESCIHDCGIIMGHDPWCMA